MNKQLVRRVKPLIDEVFGCFGMLAEIRIKCKMLRKKVRQAKKGFGEINPQEIKQKTQQMHSDLVTYNKRICDIYSELNSYGVFSHMV